MKRLFLTVGFAILSLMLLCGIGVAGEVYESTVISANATWTDALFIRAGSSVDVSIYNMNSPVMVIKLQKKFDEETTWDHEVDSWTITASMTDQENITKAGAGGAWYRIGCAAGDYDSGNSTVRIGQYHY